MIKTIAVIGSGTMGQGIAQVFASAGFEVLLYDIESASVTSAISRIANGLAQLAAKGKIPHSNPADILYRIKPVSDFRLLKVDLVIEAVVEKEDVKRDLFSEIEKINDQECILTTNTSSIPVTRIGSALKYPERFAGLHFFNPAPQMKLVEIISGARTSEETMRALKEICVKLNKHSVVAQDSPGFIVNRVARHFYLEALRVAEDGVADFRTIDALMRSSGFRMGPFELMDLIGIDVNYSVTQSLFDAFQHEPRFRPNRLQKEKIEAGDLGKKTGKGFYDYDKA